MAVNPPNLATSEALTQNLLKPGMVYDAHFSQIWPIFPRERFDQPDGKLQLTNISSLADLQQLVADFRGEIAVFGEWLKNFDTCSKSIAKCSATSASIISPKWLTLE